MTIEREEHGVRAGAVVYAASGRASRATSASERCRAQPSLAQRVAELERGDADDDRGEQRRGRGAAIEADERDHRDDRGAS